jgi:uncharacterized protein YukE
MGKPSEILDIKTADLKAAAPTFHEQSVALAKAAKALEKKLAALGAPWGDDEQIAEFAKTYKTNHTHVSHAVGILVDGLQSIHDAMDDMSDGFIAHEDLVKSMFSKVEVKAAGEHRQAKGDGNHKDAR